MAFRKDFGKANDGGDIKVSVEIIAEVGECFNGSLDNAKSMIEEAAKAGCDCVKFQILDMEEVASDDPEYEWFAKLELTVEDIKYLVSVAKSQDIDILFTPVSVRTAGMMTDLGIKKIKIASSFLRKTDLLNYIKQNFEIVYISTGMASLEEIKETRQFLKNKEITIFHCVSEYPTGPLLEKRGLCALAEEDAHLNMINILKKEFGDCRIGYSDHTDGIFVPTIAAALGVEAIEKHITLDRKTPVDHFNKGMEYMGTDHVLSIEPVELRKMVSCIRRVEKSLGPKVWERSSGERILIEFLRGRYVER